MGENSEKHRVRLSRGYWLGRYAVTQGEYFKVTGDRPSRVEGNDRLPVEGVSWEDAMGFCRELNGRYEDSLPRGYGFRLPTEAQWENACRAGTQTVYCYGDSLDSSQANFNENNPYGVVMNSSYLERTKEAGQYAPNDWGFYDMHGNVWEWCLDWYGDYDGDRIDPAGPQSGSFRVFRGGSWDDDAWHCRSAGRYRLSPGRRLLHLGFRLALAPSH